MCQEMAEVGKDHLQECEAAKLNGESIGNVMSDLERPQPPIPQI
jgi:hypothetical protein